jgi:phenylacetate-coenzyme A ligase PaaK-like adenylate-forming protein
MPKLVSKILAQRCAQYGGSLVICPNGISWNEADWLRRFNPIWSAAQANVPFWKNQPPVISSYQDFTRLPFMKRDQIQRMPSDYCHPRLKSVEMATTGGSTGHPLALPLYHSELQVGRANQTYARALYGIEPGDRAFIIWGHAPSMETGQWGLYERAVRRVKDLALGYYRVSAYSLTKEKLQAEFENMVRFKPAWMYSYSSSMLAFVRANARRRAQARDLGLKACIGAAEAMSDEARSEIHAFFGCPVGIEYGSVEMRVCAHTHPQIPGYYVFTSSHLIEALPTGIDRVYDVAVTKLFPAAMPLIRYLVGDQIVIDNEEFIGGPITQFQQVLGRANDNLVFPDGAEIHSETITHAIRSEPSVCAFQLHQYADRIECQLVTHNGTASSELTNRIQRRLSRIHPRFKKMSFSFVDDVKTTSAGKRRWIIRHK